MPVSAPAAQTRSRQAAGLRFWRWAPLAVFLAVVCILFPEAVFRGKTYWAGMDEVSTELPVLHLDAEAVRHGALPLWNSYNFCGSPSLGAFPGVPFFHPLNLLIFRLVPTSLLPLAVSWRILIEFFLELCLYYAFFLKVWKESSLAVFSTLAVCLSPALLMFIGQGNVTHLFPPLILYIVWDWEKRSLRSAIAWLGLALGFEIAGGQAQHAAYFLVFIFAVSFARNVHVKASWGRWALLWSAAGLLALGRDALDLFPFLQEFAVSNRVATSYWASRAQWAPPPYLALRLLMPQFLGSNLRWPLIEGNGDINFNQSFPTYVGVGAFLLCAIAARKAWRRDVLPWLAGAVLIGLASLRTPFWIVPFLLFFKAPLAHSRLSWLMPLTLAFLAPAGLTMFLKEDKTFKTRALIQTTVIVAIVAVVGAGLLGARWSLYELLPHDTWTPLALPYSNVLPDPKSSIPQASLYFAAAGAALIVVLGLRAFGVLDDGKTRWACCALLAADLLAIGRRYIYINLYTDDCHWFAPNALTDFLDRLPDKDDYHFQLLANAHFSDAPYSPWYTSNTNIPYHVREIGGFNNFLNARYSALTGGVSRGGLRSIGFVNLLPATQADLLATKYFVTPNEPRYANRPPDSLKTIFADPQDLVLEKPDAPARFHLACLAVPAQGDTLDGFLKTLNSGHVDLHRAVITDSQSRLAGDWSRCGPGPLGQLDMKEELPGRLVGHARLPRPRLLVVTESFYPGWKAFVDGKPAPIHRVNYNFQAVELPAGASDILLRYRFPHYRLAWMLAISSLALCVALLLPWPEKRIRRGLAL